MGAPTAQRAARLRQAYACGLHDGAAALLAVLCAQLWARLVRAWHAHQAATCAATLLPPHLSCLLQNTPRVGGSNSIDSPQHGTRSESERLLLLQPVVATHRDSCSRLQQQSWHRRSDEQCPREQCKIMRGEVLELAQQLGTLEVRCGRAVLYVYWHGALHGRRHQYCARFPLPKETGAAGAHQWRAGGGSSRAASGSGAL